MNKLISRRSALTAVGGASLMVATRGWTQSTPSGLEATFVFTNDVHACRLGDGLSPNCALEGKTDANLIRHIAGINNVSSHTWPRDIGGQPTGLARAGDPIAIPLGVVVGGDMTDDGGGERGRLVRRLAIMNVACFAAIREKSILSAALRSWTTSCPRTRRTRIDSNVAAALRRIDVP